MQPVTFYAINGKKEAAKQLFPKTLLTFASATIIYIQHTMNIIKTALLVMICTAAITGCEKVTIPYEDGSPAGSDGGSDGPEDVVEIEEHPEGTLTVAEAIEADDGAQITVRGFIVGATERSMAKAIYKPPFEGKTAIILADRILSEGDGFYEDELLPVYIACYAPYKKVLNLVDNPEYWNKDFVVCGIKGQCFGQPGLKEVLYFEFTD